jgi:hypothetical protein
MYLGKEAPHCVRVDSERVSCFVLVGRRSAWPVCACWAVGRGMRACCSASRVKDPARKARLGPLAPGVGEGEKREWLTTDTLLGDSRGGMKGVGG